MPFSRSSVRSIRRRSRTVAHGLFALFAVGFFAMPSLAQPSLAQPSLAQPSVAQAADGAGVRVVASIKPVHGLVSAVMRGVGAPTLLVEGAASPHGYALTPSDAQVLTDADLIVWIGPEIEPFLGRALHTLADDARALALIDAPGVATLPLADAALKPAGHGHDDHGHDDHGHGHAGTRDGHIWLDPANAKVMVARIADELAALDPANAPLFKANAAREQQAIDRQATAIRAEFSALRDARYVVFHDAYRYFERHVGMRTIGAIAVDPEIPPGAGRITGLRAAIRTSGAACVFAEPQFAPAVLETVIAGTGARRGILDPLGTGVSAGPDHYQALMAGMADGFRQCLMAAQN